MEFVKRTMGMEIFFLIEFDKKAVKQNFALPPLLKFKKYLSIFMLHDFHFNGLLYIRIS